MSEAEKWPKTPRELLEKRYSAFVSQNVDFILESHHQETKEQVSRKSIEEWSQNSKWHGFKVFDEKVEGDRAYIDFSVSYEMGAEKVDQREVAEFRNEGGRWYYYDSEFPKPQTLKREGDKTGRNDPCPCGSGKKFKKCCAVAA